MLENIIKKTKNALLGSLMLAQLAGTSLANEPNMELYESVSMGSELSTVNFYRPKLIVSGEENKTQVEIITEQQGTILNQIEHTWIAIGDNPGIGKPKLKVQTKGSDDLVEIVDKSESRLWFEKKIGDSLIFFISNYIPDGVGQLIEFSNYLKAKELEEESKYLLRELKSYFKDKPYTLYHIPKGKIEGLTTGYKRILFEVPTTGEEIDYWVKVRTTTSWRPVNK